MSTLLSYILSAIQKIVNKGMFLKLYAGSGSYITILTAIWFCLAFCALIFILKKLYRW